MATLLPSKPGLWCSCYEVPFAFLFLLLLLLMILLKSCQHVSTCFLDVCLFVVWVQPFVQTNNLNMSNSPLSPVLTQTMVQNDGIAIQVNDNTSPLHPSTTMPLFPYPLQWNLSPPPTMQLPLLPSNDSTSPLQHKQWYTLTSEVVWQGIVLLPWWWEWGSVVFVTTEQLSPNKLVGPFMVTPSYHSAMYLHELMHAGFAATNFDL